MGAMKKIFLLSMISILSTGLANAAVTVDEMLDPSYVMNNGYSVTTASDIIIQQSRSAGVPAPDIEEKAYYNNPVIKAVRNTFIYLDPSLEDNDRFHSDIRLVPTIYD